MLSKSGDVLFIKIPSLSIDGVSTIYAGFDIANVKSTLVKRLCYSPGDVHTLIDALDSKETKLLTSELSKNPSYMKIVGEWGEMSFATDKLSTFFSHLIATAKKSAKTIVATNYDNNDNSIMDEKLASILSSTPDDDIVNNKSKRSKKGVK